MSGTDSGVITQDRAPAPASFAVPSQSGAMTQLGLAVVPASRRFPSARRSRCIAVWPQTSAKMISGKCQQAPDIAGPRGMRCDAASQVEKGPGSRGLAASIFNSPRAHSSNSCPLVALKESFDAVVVAASALFKACVWNQSLFPSTSIELRGLRTGCHQTMAKETLVHYTRKISIRTLHRCTSVAPHTVSPASRMQVQDKRTWPLPPPPDTIMLSSRVAQSIFPQSVKVPSQKWRELLTDQCTTPCLCIYALPHMTVQTQLPATKSSPTSYG